MGGSDSYCALCGGPNRVPNLTAGDEESEEDGEDDRFHGYDRNLLKRDDPKLQWLKSSVRIMGENSSSSSTDKVYISGPATEIDNNIFSVLPGQDPNFVSQTEVDVTVYSWEAEYPWSVPFHDPCCKLFCETLKPGDDTTWDKESIYSTFRTFAFEESWRGHLDLDYGDIADHMEQYWARLKTTQYAVFNPAEIPELKQYYQNLPRRKDARERAKLDFGNKTEAQDAFEKLPPETMLSIFDHISMQDLNSLRHSSKTVAMLELTQGWWRNRLAMEQPWLYDLPLFDPELQEEVDWRQVYQDLWERSTWRTGYEFWGLVNRRRIWTQVFPQITLVYEQKADLRRQERDHEPVLLKDAKASPAPRLIHAQILEETVQSMALATGYDVLGTATPSIAVTWGPDQALSDIQVGLFIKARSGEKTDVVTIPSDDWLIGLVLFSSLNQGILTGIQLLFAHGEPKMMGSTGDQNRRLFLVTSRHFLVGLRVHCGVTQTSKVPIVTKISLLEQPIASSGGKERFVPVRASEYNRNVSQYIWRGMLPPPGIRASKPIHGYWEYDFKADLSAMHPLILGTTDEKMANIVEIAGDAQFGGFEVTYSSGEKRTIGSKRYAMKRLSIDGKGGERLVAVSLRAEHIPTCVRFVTNWGRQLVLDNQGAFADTERNLHPVLKGRVPVLAGMYAYWGDETGDQEDLRALGSLYLHDTVAYETTGGVPRGLHEGPHFWDGDAPGPDLHPASSVIGTRPEGLRGPLRQTFREVPSGEAIISWLDCSKTLSAIQVTTVHSTLVQSLPVVSIRFKYADGEQASAGVGDFPDIVALHINPETGHPWCWCFLARNPKDGKELKLRPHYKHDTWSMDNQKLQKIKCYLKAAGDTQEDAVGGQVVGLRFVREDGEESPLWGWLEIEEELDHAKLEEIVFGGNQKIEALKLFSQLNGREVTREDWAIVAFQGMSKDPHNG